MNNEPNLFSLCSGYFDKKKDTLVHLDNSEIMKCCLGTCQRPIKDCEEYCNEHPEEKKCMLNCKDTLEDCKSLCYLSSNYWGKDNPYITCANDLGCWGYDNRPIKECIKANQEEIITCCKHNCVSTNKIDCEKHCRLSNDLLGGFGYFDEQHQLISGDVMLNKQYDRDRSKTIDCDTQKARKKSYSNIFLYIILICMGVISVVLVFKK